MPLDRSWSSHGAATAEALDKAVGALDEEEHDVASGEKQT